ncbi:SDR family NAD(P)-dependent oxidoreductase [Mycetocola sp. 2940]|uniref:SDR family oxidoreductase n=1 Tax=Mycetocola sp. 2940 TaxID=3156452 RepID=UPI0033932AD3
MTTQRPLALVTGASRGIGRRVVEQLLASGYQVIATGRELSALDNVSRSLQTSSLEFALVDLDSPDVQRQVLSAIGERPLALLVANAARFAPWDETATSANIADAENIMSTNLFGTWRVVQASLPSLRKARAASIIAVGSGSGSHGDTEFGLTTNAGAVSYAVSKAALHALMRKLSTELAGEGIAVYTVDPGLTATSPGMEEFGARPIEDGATSVLAPLHAAVDPGSLTRDGRVLPW